MKKILSLILSLVMVLSLAGCGQKASATWQEHYDLGLKYVSEAKYEEAVLAFTKALEIDPKQAPVYIALAEIYVRQENYTAAQETLDKAITEIGETDELNEAMDKAAQPQQDEANTDNEPVVVRTEKREYSNGSWAIVEYDKNGNVIKETQYDVDGSIDYWDIYEYDENGNTLKMTRYNADGSIAECRIFENKLSQRTLYNSDGSINCWYIDEYDENGNRIKTTNYYVDGSIAGWWVPEYDEDGNVVKETEYNTDGTVRNVWER